MGPVRPSPARARPAAARGQCAARRPTLPRVALWAALWAMVGSAPAGATDPLDPPSRDPNDAPMMPPPHGQPRTDDQRWDPPTVSGRSGRRRVQVTLMPSFGSFFGARFLGRPNAPVRGGGATLETDVHLIDPVWLRAMLSHTVHPVNDEFTRNDDGMPVQTAAKGNVQATHVGLGVAYGLDLGRVMPLLDAGVGAMWIRSPESVADGQLGGACLSTGACDTGLTCGADSTCRVSTIPTAHAGVGLDVLLGEHLSLGASVRYFAVLLAPGTFPVYLTASLRLGARF